MLLVYGVGVFTTALRGKLQWRASPQRLFGLFGLIATYLVFGALAADLAHAKSTTEAISFGLGWQGIFGHFTRKHIEEPEAGE